jgi:hypothetical protein
LKGLDLGSKLIDEVAELLAQLSFGGFDCGLKGRHDEYRKEKKGEVEKKGSNRVRSFAQRAKDAAAVAGCREWLSLRCSALKLCAR